MTQGVNSSPTIDRYSVGFELQLSIVFHALIAALQHCTDVAFIIRSYCVLMIFPTVIVYTSSHFSLCFRASVGLQNCNYIKGTSISPCLSAEYKTNAVFMFFHFVLQIYDSSLEHQQWKCSWSVCVATESFFNFLNVVFTINVLNKICRNSPNLPITVLAVSNICIEAEAVKFLRRCTSEVVQLRLRRAQALQLCRTSIQNYKSSSSQ